MNTNLHQAARTLFGKPPRLNANDMIEWEEMPSLLPVESGRLSDERAPARQASADVEQAWGVTMPAEFDARPQPVTFREPLHGLAMREVTEPEVFRHFFG
jgi:hypothetical protein